MGKGQIPEPPCHDCGRPAELRDGAGKPYCPSCLDSYLRKEKREVIEVSVIAMKARGYDLHEALRFGENDDTRHALQRLEAYVSYAQGTCQDSVDLDDVDIEEFFGDRERILQYAG